MTQDMKQDMKKDTILHTGKGTYVRRLMNICSSAYEHMFIGTWTYVLEQAKLIVLLLILTLGPTTAWGQTGTNRSGIFYFANGGSGKSGDPAITGGTSSDNYFYLVPADNPQQGNKRDAWFSSDYSTANGDEEKPYITTYKTKKDAADIPSGVTERPHNSVWIVKFASTDSGTDYYNLIHAATGKYVVDEPPYSNNWNRKSVHLLTTDNPGENAKFEITTHQITINSINYDCYNFRPKNRTSGNKYLNAANANTNYYYSSENNSDGDADYFRGLVGLWKDAGGGSDWKPEPTLLDAPTISEVDANNKVTIEDANSLPSGYEIRYTTDGSTIPTATSTLYSGPIPITASVTIKAVVVRYGMVLTEVASETREPVPCATPVISFNSTTSEVSITCATDGSIIKYSTNGGEPTIDYNGPFSISGPTTVKAIATHATFDPSSEAELAISQVATPLIQNNGSNAISITTTTPYATIYYTTDGSTPTPSNGTEYTVPLTENVSNVTIKAIAVKENMITSTVGSGKVKLQCATPVITRDGMTFTISCSFPMDANLYYKLDGGSEMAYSGTPVSFTTGQLPMTVTAVARHSNYTASETASLELLNGSGTSDDPYLIYSATDFATFVANVNAETTSSAFYKLGIDVSASGVDAITTAFTGTFDGGLHTISNLDHALFNTVDGGVVKNVILDNVTISGGENVGAICNEATGASRIYNCGILATNSTMVKDGDGYDHISLCSSTISGSGYVGGIVGLLDGSSRVINCFSYANVSGGSHVGGIVGYNNVATTSAADNLMTMVMNCMFYGEVSGGSIAPIYNGEIITNDGDANGVNNFNYFRLESSYIQNTNITKVYHCALGAETRFLQRFEFFRYLLNSNRELAAWWATGSAANKDEMMKWVMEPSQLGTSTPYPILKAQGKYPSVVNIDAEHATTQTERNKGGKLGTLTVNIQMGNGAVYNHPGTGDTEAKITTTQLTLNITDKDPDHFNFNYYKVQLPYYNDVGTKNYTGNRVVTGWKIISIAGGTAGSYSTGADVTYDGNGNLTAMPYNFADRNCTNKDLYSVSGRVFNQGAYWDVPEGVTAITIEPYWGKAVYLSDAYWDVIYKNSGTDAMATAANVPRVGGGVRYTNAESTFNEQLVYTTMGNAISSQNSTGLFVGVDANSHTVYDYAVVLVGNYHFKGNPESSNSKPYTVTSVDLDGDNEPDYSLMLRFDSRKGVHPVKYDFLNLIGLGMAQKTTGGTGSYNLGIMQPNAWFEVTNTALFRVTQFEYSGSSRGKNPYILQGGVIEQLVTQQGDAGDRVSYFHVGGNVWFKEFHRGSHQDYTNKSTPHPPVSVTGGDYDKFYLTGLYQSQAKIYNDNAECYINGGRFGEMAGAGMEGIGTSSGNGNVTWVIDNADIKKFYGGGINYGKPVFGNIHTIISNSHVDLFCGGPKFGDMKDGRTVKTTATDCTFGTFFGAGYGGNSYNRYPLLNRNYVMNLPGRGKIGDGAEQDLDSWNDWVAAEYTQSYNPTYEGVSTQIDYQFIPMSSNVDNVARLWVEFVNFSLATTHNVTSDLTGCTITGNFYGGGSLGKVDGDVTSTLTNCTVNGSVFGAGYSASLPTVEVMNLGGFLTEPYYYEELGTYRKAVFPATTTYHWEHATDTEFTSKQVDNDNQILYTTADLTGLGTVTGKATLTINGATTVVAESVYGGGEESSVNGNTVVTVNDGTIGVIPAGQTGGATYGNVYGGGKGKYKDEDGNELAGDEAVKLGLVKGNTNVTINGGSILHNVYGGGAFGSVGNFTFADEAYNTANPSAQEELGTIVGYTDGGTANVTITGGTIGTTGKDNGMVFGSSRGDIDAPDAIHDRLAWVYNTNVIIGTPATGTFGEEGYVAESGPTIKGSVYGSGENGHTYQNASVIIHGGIIGIPSGANEVVQGVTYAAYNYPYRGNVYGGGCGTDKYYSSSSLITGTHTANDGMGDMYNPLAGIVLGTATVLIDGGQVVHNVYGAGAMGSVGTMEKNTTTNDITITNGGTTNVTISGGTVGVTVTVDETHPEPTGGNVFGAARGDANNTQTDVALVKTTNVAISNGTVKGNVYGGGECGDVGTYHTVTKEDVEAGADPLTKGNNNYLGGETSGVCLVNMTGGTVNGHVFGAGKGDYSTYECKKAMAKSATVTITNGAVGGNVYGGGEVGRVEKNTIVKIGDGEGAATGGTSTPVITGNVFGAGAGVDTHGYSALVRGNSSVTIEGNAKVGMNVYGGGQIATVGKYWVSKFSEHPDIEPPSGFPDGMPYMTRDGGLCTVTIQGYAQIGPDGEATATETAGHVFGAGKGVTPNYQEGVSHRMDNNNLPDVFPSADKYYEFLETLALASLTSLTIDGHATIKGSVYGGSENGFVQDDTNVEINNNLMIGTPGTTAYGKIYGGGKGYAGFAAAGRVGRSTIVNVNNGTMHGSVYGGGELGIVKGAVIVNINGGEIKKDVYGGGALANTNTNNWNGSALSETYVEVSGLTVNESSVVGYYTESNDTYIEATGTAEANTKYYRKVNTTVNLLGGLINGDAYGGGLGQWGTGVHYTQEEIDAASEGGDAFGKSTSDWKVKPADGTGNIKAMVYGDVFVTLGNVTEDDDLKSATSFRTTYVPDDNGVSVVNSGRVFGCNDLNGSPKGNVTVTVNRTVKGKKADGTDLVRTVLTRDDDNMVTNVATPHKYEVAAVYGGGNLADYIPVAGKKPMVRLNTCDISIEEVYGGGNAALVPMTDVLILGAHEIENVFGGGNGEDRYTVNGTDWLTNPGADVQGDATTLMKGGYIHQAYGGSNSKGTISGTVFIDKRPGDLAGCPVQVEKMVAAGNNADVNDVKVFVGCQGSDKTPLVFYGADNANVNGDVEVTITSGHFGKVFAGNNIGGAIRGHIILNIEETSDCEPIRIDELYLGGNQASYSKYGYYIKTTTSEGENAKGKGAPTEIADLENGRLVFMPRTSADDPHFPVDTYNRETNTWTVITDKNNYPEYDDPILNVISCTEIKNVFGGGYGVGGDMYADPTLNINMIPGKNAQNIDSNGDGSADNNENALGIIGDVYGGGNAAAVIGNTTINIGTVSEVTVKSWEFDGNKTYTAQDRPVEGAYIVGNVYGGGKEANVTGNTYVNICAVIDDDNTTADVIEYKGVTISGTNFEGVVIKGNVFGGGKGVTEDAGVTDAFKCAKAMVGIVNSNDGSIDIMHEVTSDGTSKGTRVSIGNGTIEGTVYGGGEVGRVEWNGVVTIGLPVGSDETSQPQITGNVFGGGKGVEQYGYAALLRGNTFVTVQANAKVGKSVYGGGEIASVGKYQVATAENVADEAFMAAHPGIEKGMPYSLANEKSGYCNVIVRGNAEIGPDNMQMTKTGGPDDEGHVFGAGKGILPYENEDDFKCQAENHNGAKHPGRMGPTDDWECYNGQEAKYLRFIETQALATHTEVFVGGDAFVKGSVYGGSLSGHVQHDTHVTIAGDCQIGVGYDTSTGEYQPKYTNWPTETQNITESLAECAHWTFDAASAPYDPYAQYQDPDDGKWYYDSDHTKYANGGSSVATDGHTYYGNVFGGGSGVVPYAAGKWHREAGTVGGNTVVDITGGHILTSVYGGNEHTDVGTYDPSTRALLAGTGKCTINMTGGTVGVPRTLADIAAHPVTCYVFGAGKGDSRTSFNEWTNVGETQVNISGNARIYGSTFGGGEDGHVLGDAETNIGGTVTIGGTGHDYPTTINDQNPGVIIGTQGLSGADGNIFGGGRGFSEDALTAGVVCGNVRVNIHNGKMLGSIFGGGRLASVGTHLAPEGNANYGVLIPENKNQVIGSTDVDATGATHGHITININGGTIGATDAQGKLLTSTSSIGDVFGGSKGARSDTRFGMAKYTTITMKAGQVNGNVYGGGELGNVNENTEVDIQGGTVAKNVFGGGKGADNLFTCEQAMVGEENMGVTITGEGESATYTLQPGGTTVSITKGRVKGNVYGGGEIGRVERNTQVTIGAAGGTDIPIVEGSVFGAGAGLETHGYSALVRGTSTVTVQGSAEVWKNVYGGGEKASLGRYWVATTPALATQYGVRQGMPYGLKSGGKGTVTIQDNAVIGTDNDSNTGHVYGAGQGIEPRNYDYVSEDDYEGEEPYIEKDHKPRRMIMGNGWEYFDDIDSYLQFIETLAISAETEVTINGSAEVKGSVFGGSESGFVYHDTDVKIQNGTINGSAFGGGRGLNSFAEAGRVSWNTKLSMSNGTVKGNVYGGGNLGDVGTIDKTDTKDGKLTYNYAWKQKDGKTANEPHNNEIAANNNNNTGICKVTITGGTIGSASGETANHESGHVFGAGQGSDNTWWCEKAIAYATNVSVSAGTVYGNVYGGGEVGRVEDDAKVVIGAENTTGESKPAITGSVFGAGAGKHTHGYSALVRGNSDVTVQGTALVGGGVYGGGEIASVGRFNLDRGLPKDPYSGGYCTVTIQDNAVIGSTSGTGHNVYGACKGVDPATISPSERKSMQLFENRPKYANGQYKEENNGWSSYPSDSRFVWVNYTEDDYPAFLNTLALTSHPTVTIAENATVYGSVFGGGERGVTLGDVAVNITGGTVGTTENGKVKEGTGDVYGGGALADTNKGNWDESQYVEVTGLAEGHTITDLYTRTGSGTTEDPYIHTKTTDVEVDANKTYYSKGTWATGKYDASTHTTTYKTNVTLTGGTIKGNVYGGGLGQIAREGSTGSPAQGTEGEEGYVPAVPDVAKLDAVKAKVYGDVLVNLNGTPVFPAVEGGAITYTPTGTCVVQGSIFGCNNQNGSPQSDVTVHVYKTQGWTGHEGTAKADLNNENTTHTYHVKAVYGGGNLSAFYPDLKATRDIAQAYVIVDGCDLTSIQTVYGGGNAASSPATNVTINATYEIEEVFGGGNGKEDITINGVPMTNPGANVGYEAYPTDYDIPNSSKEVRTAKFSYGSGKASVNIYGGVIHRVFGGSNTKGNVRESAVTMLQDMEGCDFQIDEAYGGGKSAPMDANAELLMACIPGLKQAYGGAEDADIKGGVTLTITNGTFDRVFGGNNKSGTISGPIVVNVEETGCRPIIIGELYGGGNLAGYSIYGYKKVEETVTVIDEITGQSSDKIVEVWKPRTSDTDGDKPLGTPYASPIINVRSFTSIGDIYGGGYGESAVMAGDPTVNINVAEGKYINRTQSDLSSTDSDYNEYDENGYKGNPNKLIAGAGHKVVLPPHKAGTIGVIQNVYGGGNAAKVIGTPNVYIGTRMGGEVYMAEIVEEGQIVTGCYTFTKASGAAVAGTTYYQENDGAYKPVAVDVGASVEDYYTQASFSGTAVAGTTYYKKYTIKGADIRGNVYGGGNAAEVTGNTNVVIGKEQ